MKMWFERSVPRCVCVFSLLLTAWSGLATDHSAAFAEERTVLKGKVSDAEGQTVEGAMVFVYNSPDVKRPADFISARTAQDGLFRMVLAPGRYWLVARLKKTEGYGPLMPGDKHSGDPAEIELGPGTEAERDFIVADLKDAIKIREKARERPVKISGRIIDENGSPVRRAYVIANRKEKGAGIPDYLSTWVDHEGSYTLYIPRGRYYIGSAVTFPPVQDYFAHGEMTFDGDRSAVDIVRKSDESK
jgi:hypothetical protein